MKYFSKYNITDIIVSLGYTLLFILYYGIIYQTADQGEHLSLVYKMLSPELYAQDFYVNVASDMLTIRYAYVHTLVLLGKILPLHLVIYTLLIICIYTSIRAFIAISKLIFGEDTLLNTAPFFILFIFYYWTIGGNSIQYNILISSSFAKAFALWSFYFFLKRRYIMAGILLGMAGNFQLLVGLQLFVIYFGVVIIEKVFFKSTPLKSLIVLALGYFSLNGWLLFRIAQRQFTLSQCDEQMFYNILYIFRNPQHYLPAYFPVNDYIKLIILLSAGTVIIFIYAKKHYSDRILIFNTVIVLGLITYTICLEYFGWKAIGKSQFYKTTIWLQMISSLSIASYFNRKILIFNRLSNFLILIILLVFFIFQSYKLEKSWTWDQRTPTLKDLSVMHTYIRHHTDTDALFLTFPKDESFICEAQRSQYVAFNPIVHESCYMNEWFRRYEHLLNHPLAIKKIGSKAWNYLEDQYPLMVNTNYSSFDYILLPKGIVNKIMVLPHLEIKYESTYYVLYKTIK